MYVSRLPGLITADARRMVDCTSLSCAQQCISQISGSAHLLNDIEISPVRQQMPGGRIHYDRVHLSADGLAGEMRRQPETSKVACGGQGEVLHAGLPPHHGWQLRFVIRVVLPESVHV